MRHAEPDAAAGPMSMRTVVAASFSGALLEWYDFFLFGTATAIVFNKVFFPGLGASSGTIATFLVFGLGFVARPIGGVLFGHLGDRVGRRTTLVMTLAVMGTGTVLIGALPDANAIGIWSPILLIVLRIAQGIGLGGEFAGAALITIEHAPAGRRGFWGSIPGSASSAGLLLGTGFFALVRLMPHDDFLAWGWRIPFLASGVMLAVGMWIRLKLAETPIFRAAEQEADHSPLRELLRRHPRETALATGVRLAETVAFNVYDTFVLAYVGTTLALGQGRALAGVLIGSGCAVLLAPLFGLLVDRLGGRTVYAIGATFTVVTAFPVFWAVRDGGPVLAAAAIAVAAVFGPALMFSGEALYFADLFGTTTRFTGLSVAYQVSAIVGGFVPLAGTWLVQRAGNDPWPVAGALAGICLISLGCLAYARGDQLRQADAETAERLPEAELVAA